MASHQTAMAARERRRFNPEQFDAFPDTRGRYVNSGDRSGMVPLTWQHDDAVQSIVLGFRDVEPRTPMRRDSISRIAPMPNSGAALAGGRRHTGRAALPPYQQLTYIELRESAR